MKELFRIGQIVPSSNITMETEIPAMLRARESIFPERFTFHSSRMRMKSVTESELKKMDSESSPGARFISAAANFGRKTNSISYGFKKCIRVLVIYFNHIWICVIEFKGCTCCACYHRYPAMQSFDEAPARYKWLT